MSAPRPGWHSLGAARIALNKTVDSKSVGSDTVVMVDRLPPALGNWAGGEAFFGRDREVEELLDYLKEGVSVAIGGWRRMGKTSLVRAALRALPPGMEGLFVDAERHRDGSELYAAIAVEARRHRHLWSRIHGQVKRLAKNVDVKAVEAGPLKVELQAALRPTWRDEAHQMMASLAEAGPLVIAVDELPLLLDRLFDTEADQGPSCCWGPCGRTRRRTTRSDGS